MIAREINVGEMIKILSGIEDKSKLIKSWGFSDIGGWSNGETNIMVTEDDEGYVWIEGVY